eukprot:TRINITY_DN7841_c0_g1_i1.p1 TRINITY_DN7841_c0_g1~~TRINITY_DN7841_c0_g1_i1.p1  ORF type:complete len:143 (-),score=50.21 TRINITY_DN7841_c0_g1_i1:141-542(-)
MEEWEGDDEEYRKEVSRRDRDKMKEKLKNEGFRDSTEDLSQYSERITQEGFNDGFKSSAGAAFRSSFLNSAAMIVGKNDTKIKSKLEAFNSVQSHDKKQEIWQEIFLELNVDNIGVQNLDEFNQNYNPFSKQL